MTADGARRTLGRHEPCSTGVGEGIGARVVALAFINYVDRGNLATAAPLIRNQLGLSHTQLGVLLTAFFWSYAPAQLPAGWLAERLDPRRVLAVGLAVWGTATALTGFATSFTVLLALRLMLGLGESAMYPASFKMRNARRGIAHGVGRLAGGVPAVRCRIAPLAMALVDYAASEGRARIATAGVRSV